MSEKTPDGAMGSSDGKIEAGAVAAGVPSICPAIDEGTEADSGERSGEQDPFAGGAEEIAADEAKDRIVRLGGLRPRVE